MKIRYRLIGAAITVMVLMVIIVSTVSALPGQPLRLYGNAEAPIAVAAVVVTVPGVECPKAVAMSNGQYVINVPADDPDTGAKEGAVTDDLVSVFVDPSQPSLIPFPAGGGFKELPVMGSTSQFLTIELAVTSGALTFTVAGTIRDGSNAQVTGADVVVIWGDGTGCSKTTSAAVTGGFSMSHTYSNVPADDLETEEKENAITITAFAYKAGAAAALTAAYVEPTVAPIISPPPFVPSSGGSAPAVPAATPIPTSEETIEDLSSEIIEDVAELSSEEAADIVAQLELDVATLVVEGLDAQQGALIIENLDVEAAADIVQEVTSAKAAEIVEELDTETGVGIIEAVEITKAVEIVELVELDVAVAIIEAIEITKAAEIIQLVETTEAVEIVEVVGLVTAVAMIEVIQITKAAEIIQLVETTKAVEIIEEVETERGADIIEEVLTPEAASIMANVTTGKASDVLSEVKPVKAGGIFDQLPTTKLTGIVHVMEEDRLIERLPEMSAQKLVDIPVEVLFEKLPKVNADQLVLEVVPEADPDLSPAVGVRVTPSLVVYEVPETGELVWTPLVGSPAPLVSVLGKFTSQMTGIQVNVEDLAEKPADAPDLPEVQIVNSLFSIGVEGTTSGNLSVAHVTLFVEKSWVEANQVHKWSIQFNRLDEELNIWVPFPSKRIDETDERIFYTVVVPGFSVIAITGTTELPELVVHVGALKIEPAAGVVGGDVTISAKVTNTGSSLVVYPARLWLNDTIEATQVISVPAGDTVDVAFTITKPEGFYSVRIERLLGDLVVGTPPTPTPTPRPTATATPIPTATTTPVPTATATPVSTATATPVPAATATPVPTAALTAVPAATVPPVPTATAVPVVPTSTPVPPVPTPTTVPIVAEASTSTPGPTATPVAPIEEPGAPSPIMIIVIVALLAAGGAVAYFYIQKQRGGPPPGPAVPVEPTPKAQAPESGAESGDSAGEALRDESGPSAESERPGPDGG